MFHYSSASSQPVQNDITADSSACWIYVRCTDGLDQYGGDTLFKKQNKYKKQASYATPRLWPHMTGEVRLGSKGVVEKGGDAGEERGGAEEGRGGSEEGGGGEGKGEAAGVVSTGERKD